MPISKVGQVAIKGALMAGSMALQMTQRIEGPRLKSTDITTADYGTPLERFWGKRRLLGRPIIHAEKLREKKTTSKTKGGKYSEYKYFGTFAVAVADHEIQAISRIWMDKHLVYDATNAGPISSLAGLFVGLSGAPVKISNGRNMRIYLGAEDQGIDPRIESWCEDRYGADTAPAYRGVSYIMFEEIPLEKFGNRLPQIDVEAISLSDPDYLFETIEPTGVLMTISRDHSRVLFYNTDGSKVLDMWDVPTRQRIITTTFDNIVDIGLDIDAQGRIWSTGGTLGDTLRCFSEGGNLLVSVPTGQFTENVYCIGDDVLLLPYAGAGEFIVIHPVGSTACTEVDIGFTPTMCFGDASGNAWVVGTTSSTLHLYDVGAGSLHDIAIPGGATGASAAFFNADGNIFVMVGSTVFVVDAEAFTVLDSAVIAGIGSDSRANAKFTIPGTSRFWGDEKEIDTQTLDVLQTIDLTDWTSDNTTSQWYLAPLHGLLGQGGGGAGYTIRYLDRVASNGIDLGDVVADVAEWCGVETADVSDLDQIIQGYSVVQGSGKDMIAPLLDIHDVDPRPHDFGIQFLTRGGAPLGTINVAEFVREGDEPRYRITIAQDTDLPRQITLSYADQDSDQQSNTVVAQRPLDAADTVRTQQIDLTTYVGTAGDMQKALDRYFRSKWNRRETVDNGLTAQYLGLEPADIYTLELDDVTWTGKVEKITLTGGQLAVEWKRDETGLHTLGSGTGADMGGRDDEELYVPSPTKGFIKDIPLTEDSLASDLPLLRFGAGDYGSGSWPGAGIYRLDGLEYDQWNAVDSSDKAVWGYAKGVLGGADPWLWDRGNTVTIDLKGELSSCTEADINADPTLNMALLGDELINFTTATLNGDGTYTLSGFKRGRRGTEWACNAHATGEEFILVSDLQADALGLSEVGLGLTFKAQSHLRDIVSAPAIELTFTGASLKPYAPARVKASFDGTDWTFEVIRRTRVGGAWNGSTIALGEASEAYSIDIYDGADVVDTLSLTGTNTVVWTNAEHVAAFGSTQTTMPGLIAYQISAAVGRGFALAA
jgi:hypothetical protein